MEAGDKAGADAGSGKPPEQAASPSVHRTDPALDWLRRAREARGLTLEQAAAAVDIRPAYVEALERGELGRQLGPAYALSMLTRYASYLGFDAPTVLAYAEKAGLTLPRGADAPGADGALVAPPATERRWWPRGWVLYVALGLLLAVLGLVAVVAAFQLGLLGGSDTTAARVASPPVRTVTTRPAVASSAGVTSVLPVGVSAFNVDFAQPRPFALELGVMGKTQVTVTDAETGRLLYSGMRLPGPALVLHPQDPVRVRAGTPWALRLTVQGKKQSLPPGGAWRVTSAGASPQATPEPPR